MYLTPNKTNLLSYIGQNICIYKKLLIIGELVMTKKERDEIFKAINNVSKKVNEASLKLDELVQRINSLTNEKISFNSGGIDEIGTILAVHDEAIDELANIISS